jgi:hypothetical protein
MTNLTLLFLLPFIALAAWLLGVFTENKKKSAFINSLEAKVKLQENRAFDLQEKLVRVQGDADLLRRALDEEKEAKQTALLELNGQIKRGMAMVVSCLLGGLVLGGTVSWFWSASAAEAKKNRQIGRMEIETRVAEVQADLLARQLDQLQIQYESLRKDWYQLLEDKLVAQTKLEILLENMTIGKEGTPALDYKKMKKSLQKESRFKSSFPFPVAS